MATFEELSTLNRCSTNLRNLGKHHKRVVSGLKTQTTVLGNTTEQLVAGYEMYGLENDLVSDSLAQADVPGLTTEASGLQPADAAKLKTQPEVGDSFAERKSFYGNHPPVTGLKEKLASSAEANSILPWTPHPQHSYQDNAPRVANRTGRKRPVEPS